MTSLWSMQTAGLEGKLQCCATLQYSRRATCRPQKRDPCCSHAAAGQSTTADTVAALRNYVYGANLVYGHSALAWQGCGQALATTRMCRYMHEASLL
jgi:hypothetical protein